MVPGAPGLPFVPPPGHQFLHQGSALCQDRFEGMSPDGSLTAP